MEVQPLRNAFLLFGIMLLSASTVDLAPISLYATETTPVSALTQPIVVATVEYRTELLSPVLRNNLNQSIDAELRAEGNGIVGLSTNINMSAGGQAEPLLAFFATQLGRLTVKIVVIVEGSVFSLYSFEIHVYAVRIVSAQAKLVYNDSGPVSVQLNNVGNLGCVVYLRAEGDVENSASENAFLQPSSNEDISFNVTPVKKHNATVTLVACLYALDTVLDSHSYSFLVLDQEEVVIEPVPSWIVKGQDNYLWIEIRNNEPKTNTYEYKIDSQSLEGGAIEGEIAINANQSRRFPIAFKPVSLGIIYPVQYGVSVSKNGSAVKQVSFATTVYLSIPKLLGIIASAVSIVGLFIPRFRELVVEKLRIRKALKRIPLTKNQKLLLGFVLLFIITIILIIS